ncbi:MAG TPA: hypothetical protein PKD64_11815 [Pirellulaceae bacterium]|nr:hypothetical protein [Pirellulaceae bacterium]HMO92871.1 hypothetical protein [Pirellulaceae bacterium]HMP71096.1 hypothetical protein [Pirellulaceae bacterium]
MKTILKAGIVGAVLFAISATASWYLLNQQNSLAKQTADEIDPELEAGVPPIGQGTEKAEQLPVALRPEVPLSVEAVLELSDSIRRKERDLIARENAVEKTEQNIHLLFEDLKVERAELTALLEKIEARLQLTKNAVAELKQENLTLAAKTDEISKFEQQLAKRKATGTEELDEIGQRVKTAKPWFEGLDDAQAANYLKEFANNGDLRFAVRLLKSLQQRKASKILAEFNDPEFVQQLLNALAEETREDLGENTRRPLY